LQCARAAFAAVRQHPGMARPLRQEDYEGAMHHVFVRGVARSAIAVDADDYIRTLGFLERTISRFELRCHAWCYLPNHAHLLVTSTRANLSDAMQWFGTCAAQSFNQRHARSGHLYQGRFGSRLVEDEGYLLELARYLPLNPVRAVLCEAPEGWPWSSYAATVGLQLPPWYLDSGPFLGLLGSRDAYVRWVRAGIAESQLDADGAPLPAPKPPLAVLLADPNDGAIATAFHRHGYSKAAIAEHLGSTRWQVERRLGRIVRDEAVSS
jgi:REP element-mobilizing transposase RayT